MKAVAVVVALACAQAAWACGNEVELQKIEKRVVQAAEVALSEGRYRRVVGLLEGYVEHGFTRDAALARRVEALLIVAQVRRGRREYSWSSSARARSVVVGLRRLRDAEPESPWLRARLAEALAGEPGGAAEARALLEELAARDLLPDAEARATLERLRHARRAAG